MKSHIDARRWRQLLGLLVLARYYPQGIALLGERRTVARTRHAGPCSRGTGGPGACCGGIESGWALGEGAFEEQREVGVGEEELRRVLQKERVEVRVVEETHQAPVAAV